MGRTSCCRRGGGSGSTLRAQASPTGIHAQLLDTQTLYIQMSQATFERVCHQFVNCSATSFLLYERDARTFTNGFLFSFASHDSRFEPWRLMDTVLVDRTRHFFQRVQKASDEVDWRCLRFFVQARREISNQIPVIFTIFVIPLLES